LYFCSIHTIFLLGVVNRARGAAPNTGKCGNMYALIMVRAKVCICSNRFEDVFTLCGLRVFVSFCVSCYTGHFVMVPLNLAYLQCLQHSFWTSLQFILCICTLHRRFQFKCNVFASTYKSQMTVSMNIKWCNLIKDMLVYSFALFIFIYI